MLRSVLGDYLDGIKEREFDLPLLLLLPTLGYFDIHFTHGHVEFGRDIIAKKYVNGNQIQYSFQSKAGDIGRADWRKDIRGQLETALWTSLSHPNFDLSLPHQVVLVTTGDLKHSAAIEFQAFNQTIQQRHGWLPIELWAKHYLVDVLLEHGLVGVYRANAEGFHEFGQFFQMLAKALQAEVTPQEIENYSRHWSSSGVDHARSLLLSAIESEVLAQRCAVQGLVYEAAQLHLARMRLLCEAAYAENTSSLDAHWREAAARLFTLCSQFIYRLSEVWYRERNLLKTWFGELYIVSYPAQCLRILELASIAYFFARDPADKGRLARFISDFVQAEPGSANPIGDRYAVSLALAALTLIDQNQIATVATLLERAMVWVCDRYEHGMGLAGVEADEQAETNRLLGFPFESVDLTPTQNSFLATCIADLAAFIGDNNLYSDVINDLKAVSIYAEYWQPRDSIGACRIEGEDVLTYPSVDFADSLQAAPAQYGSHIGNEASSFAFVDLFGVESSLVLMALLRDRYFPKLWSRLTPGYGLE